MPYSVITTNSGTSAQVASTDLPAMTSHELGASNHARQDRRRLRSVAIMGPMALPAIPFDTGSTDIRFASTDATFGPVFLKIGVSDCDMGTSYFLPPLVGASRSAELLSTARIFEADEALRIGLVTDVVEPGTVVERALDTARLIRANAPFATWMTKETMWQTLDAPPLRHALDIENRTQIMCAPLPATPLKPRPRSARNVHWSGRASDVVGGQRGANSRSCW